MLILLPTFIDTVCMGTSMQIVSIQQEEITEDDNVLYNSSLVRSRLLHLELTRTWSTSSSTVMKYSEDGRISQGIRDDNGFLSTRRS